MLESTAKRRPYVILTPRWSSAFSVAVPMAFDCNQPIRAGCRANISGFARATKTLSARYRGVSRMDPGTARFHSRVLAIPCFAAVEAPCTALFQTARNESAVIDVAA